jgi:hypothetical protein
LINGLTNAFDRRAAAAAAAASPHAIVVGLQNWIGLGIDGLAMDMRSPGIISGEAGESVPVW